MTDNIEPSSLPVERRALPRTLSVTDVIEALGAEPFSISFDTQVRDSRGRYSFFTCDPVAIFELQTAVPGASPFDRLRTMQSAFPEVVDSEELPPFVGGLAGLMSYELGHAFEKLPVATPRFVEIPDLLVGLFDWTIAWDHRKQQVDLYRIDLSACLAGISSSATAAVPLRRCERTLNHEQRLIWLIDRLQGRRRNGADISAESSGSASGQSASRQVKSKVNHEDLPVAATAGLVTVRSNFDKRSYLDAVERVIEYIRAGDIFQANLSQQLFCPWTRPAEELYGQLRRCNAAPYAGWLRHDDFVLMSASPERFLQVTPAGRVETRPIKGTRPRRGTPVADLFTGDELRASEKDRAENVMIVDLLRNDLSRVSLPGTVKVEGLCEVESYRTVQHLVSTISGQLKPDADVWDLFAACFPGGSITGAPKIRAMEIITELEGAARGPYCGSLFYVSVTGHTDSSILIRTFLLQGGWLQFPVGGGVVADSQRELEYSETLHKAAGLLMALTGTPR